MYNGGYWRLLETSKKSELPPCLHELLTIYRLRLVFMKWDTVKHSSNTAQSRPQQPLAQFAKYLISIFTLHSFAKALVKFPPIKSALSTQLICLAPSLWVLLAVANCYLCYFCYFSLFTFGCWGLAARKIYAKCPGMRWSSTHFRHDTADLTWLYSTWLDTSSARRIELGDLRLLETWAGASSSSSYSWMEPR